MPSTPVEPWRVVLVDDHEVSRGASRALLRTEGVDVVADLDVGAQAIEAVTRLRPEAVIVDVTPVDGRGLALAWRLRHLEPAPAVLLTSSSPRTEFGERLSGFAFVAKSELCCNALALILTPPHSEQEKS